MFRFLIRALSLVLVIFSLVILVCPGKHATDVGAFSETGINYFPLRGKLRWQYRVQDLTLRTDEIVEIELKDRTYVEGLHRDAVILDEKAGGIVYPTAYFAEGGFLLRIPSLAYNDKGEIDTMWSGETPHKVLPSFFHLGQEWSDEVRVRAGGDNHIRQSAKIVAREKVTVPAGTFSVCYRIESAAVQESLNIVTGKTSRFHFFYTDWYGPDIGLVKSIAAEGEKGRVVSTIELIGFSR